LAVFVRLSLSHFFSVDPTGEREDIEARLHSAEQRVAGASSSSRSLAREVEDRMRNLDMEIEAQVRALRLELEEKELTIVRLQFQVQSLQRKLILDLKRLARNCFAVLRFEWCVASAKRLQLTHTVPTLKTYIRFL